MTFVRRLSLWLRAHPVVGDSVWTVLLAVSGIGPLLSGDDATPVWVRLLASLLLLGPLTVRRKYPVPCAYVVLLGGLVQLFGFSYTGNAQTDPALVNASDLALGIMLYTLLVYVNRRTALVYAGALAVGSAIWAVWRVGGEGAIYLGASVVFVFAFCWVLGEFVGARRAYHAEVEERLRLLETERDQQARIAVAEERSRIARELHDVVAHAVSVIVVQADGAAYAIESNPQLATRAVRTISATGRDALTELRRLLGVLREDEQPEHPGPQRAPQPGVESLHRLTEQVEHAGLPVELTCAGDLTGLPTGLSLGVYRIVQEALTNTLKHGGRGAHASVCVTRDGDTVTLEVLDSGGDGAAEREPLLVPGGNGLIGMRERVGVYGGTLRAGPRQEGGWGVHAELPVAGDG